MADGGRWAGFDVLRVVAALAVVVSHAVHLAGHPEPVPLSWGAHSWTLGASAVAVFFVASGFLVTRSWMSDPIVWRFAVRRVARIWPALLAVVVGCAFVVGPLVTDRPIGEYLTNPLTWYYPLANSVLQLCFYLPGVFSGNPDHVVNGSLWSLPIEVSCYALLAVGGVVGVLRYRWPLAAVTGAVLVWAGLGVAVPPQVWVLSPFTPALLGLFLLGSCAARFSLPRRWWLALAAVALLGASVAIESQVLGYVAFAYLVLFVGTSTRGGWMHRFGDPSYGTFLWGWPLTQVLILAGVTSTWLLVPASMGLALLAGFASWHLLERRALAATRRLLQRRRPDDGLAAQSRRQVEAA